MYPDSTLFWDSVSLIDSILFPWYSWILGEAEPTWFYFHRSHKEISLIFTKRYGEVPRETVHKTCVVFGSFTYSHSASRNSSDHNFSFFF